MQVFVGTTLDAAEGSWNGVADKTADKVLTLARSLAELPALHLKTGGMTGATGWLSLESHKNRLCLCFDGSNLAQFEWQPSFDEAAQPFSGFCNVHICLEAIKPVKA